MYVLELYSYESKLGLFTSLVKNRSLLGSFCRTIIKIDPPVIHNLEVKSSVEFNSSGNRKVSKCF